MRYTGVDVNISWRLGDTEIRFQSCSRAPETRHFVSDVIPVQHLAFQGPEKAGRFPDMSTESLQDLPAMCWG
jgi:hypothetical protein